LIIHVSVEGLSGDRPLFYTRKRGGFLRQFGVKCFGSRPPDGLHLSMCRLGPVCSITT
jgi:hypothetical protein